MNYRKQLRNSYSKNGWYPYGLRDIPSLFLMIFILCSIWSFIIAWKSHYG